MYFSSCKSSNFVVKMKPWQNVYLHLIPSCWFTGVFMLASLKNSYQSTAWMSATLFKCQAQTERQSRGKKSRTEMASLFLISWRNVKTISVMSLTLWREDWWAAACLLFISAFSNGSLRSPLRFNVPPFNTWRCEDCHNHGIAVHTFKISGKLFHLSLTSRHTGAVCHVQTRLAIISLFRQDKTFMLNWQCWIAHLPKKKVNSHFGYHYSGTTEYCYFRSSNVDM